MPCRLFEFCVGAYVAHRIAQPVRWQGRYALFGAMLLAVPVFHLSHDQVRMINGRDQLFGVFFGCVILAASRIPPKMFECWPLRLLNYIGVRSYSIYLVHEPLMIATSAPHFGLRLSSPLTYIVFNCVRAVAMIVCGFGMYALCEVKSINVSKAASVKR